MQSPAAGSPTDKGTGLGGSGSPVTEGNSLGNGGGHPTTTPPATEAAGSGNGGGTRNTHTTAGLTWERCRRRFLLRRQAPRSRALQDQSLLLILRH